MQSGGEGKQVQEPIVITFPMRLAIAIAIAQATITPKYLRTHPDNEEHGEEESQLDRNPGSL